MQNISYKFEELMALLVTSPEIQVKSSWLFLGTSYILTNIYLPFFFFLSHKYIATSIFFFSEYSPLDPVQKPWCFRIHRMAKDR